MKALVLFSGGQDSATCLAWALDRFDHVETIGFDYGQRHRVELDTRAGFRAHLAAHPTWAARLGADHLLTLDALGAISETSLTRVDGWTTSANTSSSNASPVPRPVFGKS